MNPLSPNEFNRAIKQGLGRAVIHARTYGVVEEMVETVLQNCRRHLGYDPQSEGRRDQFLFELLQTIPDYPRYFDELLQALETTDEIWDSGQLYELAVHMAQSGYEKARTVMYRRFAQQSDFESWHGGQQIVTLDGMPGLLFVVDHFGSRLQADPALREDDILLREAYALLGEEVVTLRLRQESLCNPFIKTYLEHTLDREDSQKYVPAPQFTLDDVVNRIETERGQRWRLACSSFGRTASEQELDLVLDRLRHEERKEQILRYLFIFWQKAFPPGVEYFIELAQDGDEDIAYAAIMALSLMKHESIYTLAVKMIHEKPERIEPFLTLLVANYQPGDATWIRPLLELPFDNDVKHSLTITLLEIAAQHHDKEFVTCLLWGYEATPCSYCRGKIVAQLLEWGEAPPALLEECLWDCAMETRHMAQSALEAMT